MLVKIEMENLIQNINNYLAYIEENLYIVRINNSI